MLPAWEPPSGPPPPPAHSGIWLGCEPPGPPEYPPPKGPPPSWQPCGAGAPAFIPVKASGPLPSFDIPPTGFPPGFEMPPNGFPPGLDGFPAGFPPGMPPDITGLPPDIPPTGFPPGFPVPPGPEVGPPVQGPAPNVQHAQAAEAPAAAKKRSNKVEGLASSKKIKTGGSVTIYEGYTAIEVKRPKDNKAVLYAATSASSAPAAKPAQARAGLERLLPAGWEMRKSKSTGKVYYVNEKEGKTQWEPPAGSSVSAPADTKKRKSSMATPGLEASVSSKNGVTGLVRATQQTTGKWQKWQRASQLLNEEDGAK